ncbi:DUF5062 family protein [Thalassotalea euphylliae]|uniref:DUF5062 family protein n=1 Tax=Thalassotalea euphylliae TaxID=1655234 RepID=A0A3E0UEQ2_9GAMM|nr:DUF5062 family protein [Thalassotalea euphylliae]REL30058.1 DUF5062 family protein [Thalassotalea euphylliae]REL35037.1 DUF5062 family protein [Thalassotalea euphylliae]
MKKIKHEKELLKKALTVGETYAKKRGYQQFSASDSHDVKIECIYRLLVNDKLVIPLPAQDENLLNIKKRLVKWIMNQLPDNHPLLQ